jgi:hypothetical protein
MWIDIHGDNFESDYMQASKLGVAEMKDISLGYNT